MQRSDREVGREDGLDRWGECVDRSCVGRRWGECVDGQPVPENSPWVCVWLGDRSGWTDDRLAELDRVRWSGSVWIWALTHRGSAAFGAVIVWLSSAWPAWGRSMSVAGSELWFFLSLVYWIGALDGWIRALVLSLTRWLGRRVCSGSRFLCVVLSLALSAFFLSLSLCCSFSRSLCVLSLRLCVLRDPEMIWSENESVKSFPGQRRKFRSTGSEFLENFIFRCCQTCGFGGKWFPEIIFTQNKRTLNERGVSCC